MRNIRTPSGTSGHPDHPDYPGLPTDILLTSAKSAMLPHPAVRARVISCGPTPPGRTLGRPATFFSPSPCRRRPRLLQTWAAALARGLAWLHVLVLLRHFALLLAEQDVRTALQTIPLPLGALGCSRESRLPRDERAAVLHVHLLRLHADESASVVLQPARTR